MQGLNSIEPIDRLDTSIPRRHVSPAILETRIELLKLELAETKYRLKEAENTILGYVIKTGEAKGR